MKPTDPIDAVEKTIGAAARATTETVRRSTRFLHQAGTTAVPTFLKPRARKPGLSPGSFESRGEDHPPEPVRVTIRRYSVEEYSTSAWEPGAPMPVPVPGQVAWVDVEGVHDTALLKAIGETYGVHALVLEDVCNLQHRPKFESYEEYLFIVAKSVALAQDGHSIEVGHVALLVFPGLVITFRTARAGLFAGVLARLEGNKGRVRRMGSDYLAYALLDEIVDYYIVVLEDLGERIDGFDEQLLRDPKAGIMHRIQSLKGETLLLRKAIWPLREAVGSFERTDSDIVEQRTRIFLGDVRDHAEYAVDSVDTFRDVLTMLTELYLSSLSNRQNEIMKTLTLMATIFMPLTFLAGIYGMNFEWMPELGWKYSYPALLGVMVAMAVALLLYFRRRRWL